MCRAHPFAPVFLVILPCTFFVNSAGVCQGRNLVVNGGFEDLDAKTGVPARWSVWHSEVNKAVYTLARAHSGVAAAAVTCEQTGDSQGLRCSPAPAQVGKVYRVSAWVYIEDLKTGSFSVYLEFWNAGGTRIKDTSVSTQETGQWLSLAIEGEAPPDTETVTTIVYGSSGTVGRAYFDDVEIGER